jgi:hypothetical protein
MKMYLKKDFEIISIKSSKIPSTPFTRPSNVSYNSYKPYT